MMLLLMPRVSLVSSVRFQRATSSSKIIYPIKEIGPGDLQDLFLCCKPFLLLMKPKNESQNIYCFTIFISLIFLNNVKLYFALSIHPLSGEHRFHSNNLTIVIFLAF